LEVEFAGGNFDCKLLHFPPPYASGLSAA